MKKVNFNAAKNFEVPESWIEKALNAKPKKKPLYLRPYVIGSAAGVVLAVAVTVFAVIFTSQAPISPQSPVPVKPKTTTVSSTAPTEPKPSSEQPTTRKVVPTTAPPTEPEPTEPEPTQPEPTQPKPTEASAEARANTVPAEKKTEPTEDNGTQYPYSEERYQLSDSWEIMENDIYPASASDSSSSGGSNSASARNESAREVEIPPDMLKVSELYTGTITVRTAADSPYNVNGNILCEISSYYAPADKKIDGVVSRMLTDGENGEKTVRFNLYDCRKYIPSGYTYTFTFAGKTADGEPVTKTVTQILSGKQSVNITI